MTEDNHNCRQCDAEPGNRHIAHILPSGEKVYDDLARCVISGIQLIQCDDHESECIPVIWDGEYPGVKECREYGMYTPEWTIWGETEDLNSLMVLSTWDSDNEKYVMNSSALSEYREKYDTIYPRPS